MDRLVANAVTARPYLKQGVTQLQPATVNDGQRSAYCVWWSSYVATKPPRGGGLKNAKRPFSV